MQKSAAIPALLGGAKSSHSDRDHRTAQFEPTAVIPLPARGGICRVESIRGPDQHPSVVGIGLEQLASVGRHAKGAISLSADQKIQRSNFYVLISVWETAADRLAFESSVKATALLTKIQPLLEAPIDIRPGSLIE